MPEKTTPAPAPGPDNQTSAPGSASALPKPNAQKYTVVSGFACFGAGTTFDTEQLARHAEKVGCDAAAFNLKQAVEAGAIVKGDKLPPKESPSGGSGDAE